MTKVSFSSFPEGRTKALILSYDDGHVEDRRRLEELCGYPVRGMSFPYGEYNRELLELLPALGIEYARTVEAH